MTRIQAFRFARLRQATLPLLIAALLSSGSPAHAKSVGHKKSRKDHAAESSDASKTAAQPQNAYDFTLPSQDGKNIQLSDFKGKVLLIVNLARDSSYASQLAELEKLNQTWKDKGLVIIGVPSNDFGNCEPGSDADITKAYSDAGFLVTARSTLTGVHELPLFTYLADSKSVPNDGLHWNYTKFIVDRKGNVILRFGPEVDPSSLDLTAPLEEVIDGTWKAKKSEKPKVEEAGDDDSDA